MCRLVTLTIPQAGRTCGLILPFSSNLSWIAISSILILAKYYLKSLV